MAKFTDAVKATIKTWFNAGDQPTEAQFASWIDDIQDGIDEHDHTGAANGDGMVLSIPLTSLGSWAVGRMIIGGVADWAALSPAGAAGHALVSDATSFVWDQTPAWTGSHAFNAGLSVAAGQDIVMGNASSIGIGGALERIEFYEAGHICVLGANFGVGTDDVDGRFTVEAASSDTIDDETKCHHLFRDTDNVNYWKTRIRNTGQMYCKDYISGGTWFNATTIDRNGNYYVSILGGGGNQDVGADDNGKLYVPFVSDRKLKSNIEPLTKGLEVILALRGVTFDWNKEALADVGLDFGDPDQQVGLIAQEVVEVIPQARSDGKEYQSYRRDMIVPYLVKAIQEQQAQIEALQRRV